MNAAAATLTVPPLIPVRSVAKRLQRETVQAEVAPTDERLFELASGGDREALGTLITRYERSLYGLLVRMANGDSHRADDLFQDTFLHAMRAAETFNRKMNFKPWITAIAVNLVRDDARKRKVRGEIALDGRQPDEDQAAMPEPAAGGECPRQSLERQDREETVRRALTMLTGLEREVVLLHFFQDMTLVETAQALSVPLGTVKSRLHAALTRLSHTLERIDA